MKSFKISATQRFMVVQALNTWRGEISELRNVSMFADVMAITEEERKLIDYVELGVSASWNQIKAKELVIDVSLEDAQFDAGYKFLSKYKDWPPSIEIVNLFDSLDNVKVNK